MSSTSRRNRSLSGSRSARDQRGAVLIVGLIILVVLTMLGIQAMRTNLAQERMASNMRERNLAFQTAESALRLAERQGPYDSERVEIVGDLRDWDGVANQTGVLVGFDALLAQDPSFHIGPPQYVRIGLEIPPKFRLIYPVTSRSVGGQASSPIVLQTGFEPPN